MTLSKNHIVDHLKNALHPSLYPEEKTFSNGAYLLTRHDGGRYCLAITQRQEDISLDHRVRDIRKQVRRETGACWLLREVGLSIIVISSSPEDLDEDALPDADKTGLHAVILQGIHIIAPSGEHIFNQSAWGKVGFGLSDVISETLDQVQ